MGLSGELSFVFVLGRHGMLDTLILFSGHRVAVLPIAITASLGCVILCMAAKLVPSLYTAERKYFP